MPSYVRPGIRKCAKNRALSPRHPPCDNALFFSTGRAGPTIWELRRICRRCAGAGVTDDRQYATAPHVCSITYRYAYTETYYMQFL